MSDDGSTVERDGCSRHCLSERNLLCNQQ
ncbi:hypothetical protein [Zobellella iuensis]